MSFKKVRILYYTESHLSKPSNSVESLASCCSLKNSRRSQLISRSQMTFFVIQRDAKYIKEWKPNYLCIRQIINCIIVNLICSIARDSFMTPALIII